MYKLEFTLKQHTPIIHFQYFLSDSTLRSTELKSALDKFIIEEYIKCWSSNPTERLKAVNGDEKFKKWLKHSAKPSNPSFDYDVELIVLEPSITKVTQVADLKKYGFFGNQPDEKSFHDKKKYKKAVIEQGLIKLIVKSPYKELLNEIDKLIDKFFLLKNFGTRQSKGFGCFYPVEKYNYLKTQNILPFYFDVSEQKLETPNNKYKSVFHTINLFYSTLRSGINIPNSNQSDSNFYFKSLMWAYAKSKGEHWDKKSIKNAYKPSSFVDEEDKWKEKSMVYNSNSTDFPLGYKDVKSNEVNRHLWRDLLGLSSTEKAGNWKLGKEHTNKEITRFKSPIIFKPIRVGENQYRVFFGIDPVLLSHFIVGTKANSEAEILGKEFNIKFNGFGSLKLKYPVSFDYSDFMKFAINTYNSKSNWVESKFHDTNDYLIINAIYKQLKVQVK